MNVYKIGYVDKNECAAYIKVYAADVRDAKRIAKEYTGCLIKNMFLDMIEGCFSKCINEVI